jgi:hypothetical protein
MTVGRSRRTPAKHELMRSIVGREIGAANFMTAIHRLVWLDLTAGDGVPDDDRSWWHGCSPGILAHHAVRSTKPVDITLYEIKPRTYDRLLINLKGYLPGLGYSDVGDCWHHGETVVLRVVNASGASAEVDHLNRHDAVLAFNDPNAVTDWAMRPTFAAEINVRTPWHRSISTMGCNTGGLKRLRIEEREPWFGNVGAQQSALPRHRDLLLAAIEGDDAQWAYLLNEPVKWRSSQEKVASDAFRRFGYRLDMAWYGTHRQSFEDMKRRLFLTKDERR